jgi:hypothetical protein
MHGEEEKANKEAVVANCNFLHQFLLRISFLDLFIGGCANTQVM